MAFNIGSFGVLITRKILLKLFVGIVCAALLYETWDFVVEGPSWYLEGRDADSSLTWSSFVRDCGLQNNESIVVRNFEKKYKNVVVEWEGHVMRVDGDHLDEDDLDAELQITEPIKHYQTHNAAEVFVRMDYPLKGLFKESDYDLLLVLDKEHFQKNQDALDALRVGSDIKFKGFLRNLGKVSEHFARNNGRLIRTSAETSGESENGGEMLMPWFTVFEIEVVK